MVEFPASWVLMPVGEIVRNITITGKKIPQKSYLPSGKYPVFDQGQEYVGGYTDDASKLVDCELPVIVFGDHTRVLKLVKTPFAPGADGVKILQPDSCLLPILFEYIARYLVTKIPDNGYARHYQHLAKSLLPVPPLLEQHRIVAKIEELFSELDKGLENLKTAQAQLKVYRQALLKHAFEGKLTAQWRADNPDKLESADVLLKRIQQERAQRYQQQLAEWEAGGKQGSKPKAPKPLPLLTAKELAELPELPVGWGWTRFGLLDIDLKRGPFGSAITKSMFVPRGFKIYEQGNAIYRDAGRGSYFIDANKYADLSGFSVDPGDFIVSCAGTVGRIFEIPSNAPAGIINQALMRVRINEAILNKKFFAILFESGHFQRKVLSDAKGTAMVNLAGIKELNLVPVAVCGLSEQRVVEELLDARLSEVAQLEQTLTTSLQQSEALRQSILKKAFSGQLVPQDPHDEPASALLARIRAERTNAGHKSALAGRRSIKVATT